MNNRNKHYSAPALVAIILLTLGCGTSPTPTFYHLEEAASQQLTGVGQGLAVGVGPVNVAPYLDRPQIVTRSTGHQLKLSEFNRWAEPLKNTVGRVIIINLSNNLLSNRVFRFPRRERAIPLDYRVAIDMPRFDGELGGEVTLTARWTLYGTDDAVLLTRVSIIHEKISGMGFEGLVTAQNHALDKLSREISDAIKQADLSARGA